MHAPKATEQITDAGGRHDIFIGAQPPSVADVAANLLAGDVFAPTQPTAVTPTTAKDNSVLAYKNNGFGSFWQDNDHQQSTIFYFYGRIYLKVETRVFSRTLISSPGFT